MISSEKNFIKISATDLEIGIKWWILTKTEKEGSIAIPSYIISNFINLLPNKKVEIEVKDNNLLLKCDNYETKIKGFNSEDFPIIPEISKKEFISLKAPLFLNGLNQIVDIATPSTTRPEISGIYLLFKEETITLVATDSFRLSEKKIIFKNNQKLKNNYSLIIPQKTAKEIINIFKDEEKINIYFSNNQIMFESNLKEINHPKIQLISRLIEGEYPNYQEIIPKKYKTKIILKKDEFINQIKSASLFSGKINEVKIKKNDDNNLEIFSQSLETGEYKSIINSEINGDFTDISFNYKFLLDGLSKIKSSEIILELNGDSGPGVLKPVGDDSYLYIVMPIKAN